MISQIRNQVFGRARQRVSVRILSVENLDFGFSKIWISDFRKSRSLDFLRSGPRVFGEIISDFQQCWFGVFEFMGLVSWQFRFLVVEKQDFRVYKVGISDPCIPGSLILQNLDSRFGKNGFQIHEIIFYFAQYFQETQDFQKSEMQDFQKSKVLDFQKSEIQISRFSQTRWSYFAKSEWQVFGKIPNPGFRNQKSKFSC